MDALAAVPAEPAIRGLIEITALMSTKRPSELDIQDRVADAIWFVPRSDNVQAHYVLEYSGRGPKAYLNLWLGKEFGEELTEWNWVLHDSAVELWRHVSIRS